MTIYLTQESLPNGAIKELPGGLLTIAIACVGSGDVSVTVSPGGETTTVTCGSTGGSTGFGETGPATLPWPTMATINAPEKTRWQVLIADATGATGISSESQ